METGTCFTYECFLMLSNANVATTLARLDEKRRQSLLRDDYVREIGRKHSILSPSGSFLTDHSLSVQSRTGMT